MIKPARLCSRNFLGNFRVGCRASSADESPQVPLSSWYLQQVLPLPISTFAIYFHVAT
jgi:hypothetical protein